MPKIINSEIVQAAIRKSADGQNLAVVGAVDGNSPTCHILIFQGFEAAAVEKALAAIGVQWRQVEVKQSDFYEPRTI